LLTIAKKFPRFRHVHTKKGIQLPQERVHHCIGPAFNPSLQQQTKECFCARRKVTHQFQKYLLKLCLRYEIYLFEEVPKFEFKISSLDNEHDFQHCCFFLVIMYVSKLGSGSVTSTHFQLKHNSAESHIVTVKSGNVVTVG
jgi:hypothetical protein